MPLLLGRYVVASLSLVLPLLVGIADGLSYPPRIDLTPPLLRAVNHGVLDSVREGDQLMIATTVFHTNGPYSGESQQLVLLIEVRDRDGVTQYLAWQSGLLRGGSDAKMEIGVSWIPPKAGYYEVRAFCITDFENPGVLTEIRETEVNIENRD